VTVEVIADEKVVRGSAIHPVDPWADVVIFAAGAISGLTVQRDNDRTRAP